MSVFLSKEMVQDGVKGHIQPIQEMYNIDSIQYYETTHLDTRDYRGTNLEVIGIGYSFTKANQPIKMYAEYYVDADGDVGMVDKQWHLTVGENKSSGYRTIGDVFDYLATL